MKNYSKCTKAELLEELKGMTVELSTVRNYFEGMKSERDSVVSENHNLKEEIHSLKLNYDMLKSNYDGVEEQNQRLNDQALELDSKVKAAAEEVVILGKVKQNHITLINSLRADIDGMSTTLAEKQQQLKSAGKMQRGLFGTLIFILIVWIVTLLNFAI